MGCPDLGSLAGSKDSKGSDAADIGFCDQVIGNPEDCEEQQPGLEISEI